MCGATSAKKHFKTKGRCPQRLNVLHLGVMVTDVSVPSLHGEYTNSAVC